MGNGHELVSMCCTSYESPDEGETIVDSDGEEDEEAGGFDYCEYNTRHVETGPDVSSNAHPFQSCMLCVFWTIAAES